MKRFIYIILVLILLTCFVGVFIFINQDKLVDRFIARQTAAAQPRTDLLEKDGKIRLITVGTGSPLPGERVMSCNAVIVNGRFFLFDVGDGAERLLEQLRLPITSLEAIFITHWHADHYMDLPEVLNRSWLRGRKQKVTVYGPKPLNTIIAGLNQFLEVERGFRLLHHGPAIIDTSLAVPLTSLVGPSEEELLTVFQEDGIEISAFLVDHEPISPSLGYRITYGGKVLVISGDTKTSTNLIRHAQDADILLHEALAFDFIERAESIQRADNKTRNAEILKDIRDYHTSPIQAAEVAQKASVQKLILTHLGPAPENPISRTFYTRGMSDIYDGPILLAEDGDLFVID